MINLNLNMNNTERLEDLLAQVQDVLFQNNENSQTELPEIDEDTKINAALMAALNAIEPSSEDSAAFDLDAVELVVETGVSHKMSDDVDLSDTGASLENYTGTLDNAEIDMSQMANIFTDESFALFSFITSLLQGEDLLENFIEDLAAFSFNAFNFHDAMFAGFENFITAAYNFVNVQGAQETRVEAEPENTANQNDDTVTNDTDAQVALYSEEVDPLANILNADDNSDNGEEVIINASDNNALNNNSFDTDDDIRGYNDDDALYSHGGNDSIKGGNGDDYINGGHGSDVLFGNNGADIFAWSHGDVDADSFDTIKDFSMKEGDKIDISDVLNYNSASDDLISDFVRFSNSDKPQNTVLEIRENGEGTWMSVAEIVKGANLGSVEDMVDQGALII